MTVERTATIRNRLGLHARPAAEVVKAASRFSCAVTLCKDGHCVNGKSIMGVMTLAAECGSTVMILCEGDDADAAADALVGALTKEYVEA